MGTRPGRFFMPNERAGAFDRTPTLRVERSGLHCDFRICISDRLIESQRLDVAAELAQRIKPFRRASARIAHEVVEAVFPSDHDKMRDAAGQTHADNNWISVCDVRIDE